jgi:hypothetical protein
LASRATIAVVNEGRRRAIVLRLKTGGAKIRAPRKARTYIDEISPYLPTGASRPLRNRR